MDYISSKNICLLVREVLKLLDPRPMNAGAKTSYIVYKMLQKTGLFEEYEMAELCCIAMLRDIGAYKTGRIDELMKPDFDDAMSHAVYGYLFIKYLFPVPAYGKILLYHHMDFEQRKGISYEFEFMSDYIHLADDISMQLAAGPDTYDYHSLDSAAGIKYEDRTVRLFEQAQEEYGILDKLKGTEWKKELLDLMDYILFRNDEKKQYLQMLMYCIGFKSEYSVLDTVATICIAQEIGRQMNLDEENLKLLYYSAMLHDIGMLGLKAGGRDITYPPDQKSVELIKTHIELEEKLLRKYFSSQEVVDIAVRHHERLDGSGYPRGMKANEMTRNDRILQTASLASLLLGKGGGHQGGKQEVCRILQEKSRAGSLDPEAVGAFVGHYDIITERVKQESNTIMATYRRLEGHFEKASRKLVLMLRINRC